MAFTQGWLVGVGLWFQYDGTPPTTRDVANGRVYALNTHSHTVFLPVAESVWLYGVLGIGFLGGLAVS